MPKRYRVVHGSNEFTWEYIDEKKNQPWVLLAESHERWDTEVDVENEIKNMGGANADIERTRGGERKPAPKFPRKPTNSKHKDD